MNIYLIPYTWARHIAVASYTALAGLVAWWLILSLVVLRGPRWDIAWDGALFLGLLSAVVAGASLLAEGSLRRTALHWRALLTAGAALLALLNTIFCFFLWTDWVGPPLARLIADLLFRVAPPGDVSSGDYLQEVALNLGDPSLVSLSYRLPLFIGAGIGTGIATSIFRRLAGVLSHIGAGVAAGISGACVWYVLGYTNFGLGFDDLYLASAFGAMAYGGVFGLFAWSIPDSLYAGWLRVVTETRFGRRIPIDGPDGAPRERFVGHYPRGLDLFLPVQAAKTERTSGVMELHVSVMVDGEQRYRARGLTIQPTRVVRLLERINLRYDPRLPAPKETELQSGDRIHLGPVDERGQQTVVEFLMLPREEL